MHNLITQTSAVLEKSLGAAKFKISHVTLIIIRMLDLDIAYQCTKIDHCCFSRPRDMAGDHQNLNGSRDLTTPLSEIICHATARTCYAQAIYQI